MTTSFQNYSVLNIHINIHYNHLIQKIVKKNYSRDFINKINVPFLRERQKI